MLDKVLTDCDAVIQSYFVPLRTEPSNAWSKVWLFIHDYIIIIFTITSNRKPFFPSSLHQLYHDIHPLQDLQKFFAKAVWRRAQALSDLGNRSCALLCYLHFEKFVIDHQLDKSLEGELKLVRKQLATLSTPIQPVGTNIWSGTKH